MPSPNQPPRDQTLRVLLFAASLVVVVAGLKAAAPLILPFLVAVFLAIISVPVVTWMRAHKVPKIAAVVATVVLDVAVLTSLALIVGRSVNEFSAAAPLYQARLQRLAASLMSTLVAHGIDASHWQPVQYLNPSALVDLVGAMLGAVASVLSNTVLVLLTLIFILLEVTTFPEKLNAAFGGHFDYSTRFATITRQVQRYLVIKTLISLATGVLAGLWVGILGLGAPLLWGLMAFLFNFVPNIGSIVAAVPPIVLALVQFGVWRAVAVASGYVVINAVLATFIEPHLLGRRLGLSTLVVFLSLVFWGWVWGPVGMVLSVPLTMVFKIAAENTDDLRWLAVMLDSPRPRRRSSPAGPT